MREKKTEVSPENAKKKIKNDRKKTEVSSEKAKKKIKNDRKKGRSQP